MRCLWASFILPYVTNVSCTMSPCKTIRCQPHQTRVNSWVSLIVTPALTQLCVCLSHKTSFASQLQCQFDANQCQLRTSMKMKSILLTQSGCWSLVKLVSSVWMCKPLISKSLFVARGPHLSFRSSSSSSSSNGRSTSTFYGGRGGGCHPSDAAAITWILRGERGRLPSP